MRGDSLRDLYAKSLALVGLGLLAGAGALMDYWPAGTEMADVPSLFEVSVPSLALTVPTDVDLTPNRNPEIPRIVPTRSRVRTTPVAVTARVGERPRLELVSAIDSTVLTSQGSIALTDPQPEATGPAYTTLSASEVAFSMPVSTLASADIYTSSPVSLSDDSDDGFLSGAFKRTGTSIVKTSLKTGASLVGMVRVVGGAVRKVLPN